MNSLSIFYTIDLWKLWGHNFPRNSINDKIHATNKRIPEGGKPDYRLIAHVHVHKQGEYGGGNYFSENKASWAQERKKDNTYN